MTGTHQLSELFHFLSAQVYRCKNSGDPLIMIFSRAFYLKVYVSKGSICTVTFLGVVDINLFSGIIFFQGIELSKIKFQGIYESNNHLFQGILVLKNLVVHTSV